MSSINQFEHLKIQLEAIKSATNNFSDNNCIGRGGFGNVYKGELVHSTGETIVAFKRLEYRAFAQQGNPEFWKEIMMLSFYKHENIVSLLGYCDDSGEKILVYEYASNKSLDAYLASDDLTWVQRLKISIGVARGLAYLHTPTETHLRIFHRDIKSSNILLDHNWNAKISDFGLSKFAPSNNQFTFMVSNPTGTLGYIDPLYHETGLLTKESDVYSFGVVLFEVLCGRLCFGNNKDLRPLVGLVREYYEKNNISEIVYSNIKDEIDESCLKLFANIAYQCLKREREERPLMTQIVMVLERALDIQENRVGILKVGVVELSSDPWRFKELFESNYSVQDTRPYILLYVDSHVPLQYRKMWMHPDARQIDTLDINNFHDQELVILVIQPVSVNKHRHLGMARLKLTNLTPGVSQTYKLDVKDNNRHIDDLEVLVLYTPTNINSIDRQYRSVQKAPIGTPKDGGLLVVIIQGANLHDETQHAHSFASLLFHGELRKTKSMTNTNKPKWVEEFTFLLQQSPMNAQLHLEVVDNSWKELIPGKVR